MIKKAITFLLSASFVLSLGACGEQNPQAAQGPEENQEGDVESNFGDRSGTQEARAETALEETSDQTGGLRLLTVDGQEGCCTEQGYYHLSREIAKLADGNYAYHMMYMDFASGQEIYLCSNAGCGHDSQDCSAVFLSEEFHGFSSLLFVWQDALYILSKYQDNDGSSVSYSFASAEDIGTVMGMDGSCAVLYRANLDGTGREAVYSFDASLAVEDWVIGDDTSLYLVTKEVSAEKDELDTYYNSVDRKLICLDPASGETRDICSMEFEDSVPWDVKGCYDRTLVLKCTDYGRTLSNEEMFDDDDAYKEIYEKSKDVYATLALDDPQLVIRYSQDNKNQNSALIDGNMLYLSSSGDGIVRGMDLKTGEEQVICSRSGGFYYLLKKIGDKLCCHNETWDYTYDYIDVNTGEVSHSSLVNKSTGWILELKAVLESDVLVIYDCEAIPTEDGAYEVKGYQYGLISQEDLFAGNDNYRKINMIEKGE